MDFEQLRAFLLIAQAGGFSPASAALHRSQPALSRRIAQLEQEVGAPLFVRRASGVTLTQAGEALAPYAERALAALGDCDAAMASLRKGASGPLSVAIVGTLAGASFAAALRRFARAHPDVALTLRTAGSGDVSALVRAGVVHIGVRYHRDRDGALAYQQISDEELIVVAPPAHRLVKRGVAQLAELAGERWLAFPPTREGVEDSLFAHFRTRGAMDIAWTPIDSLTAQKRLVEAGFGLALLPRASVSEELAANTLAPLRVRDLSAANPVFLVTRRGGYLSPAAHALIALLAQPPKRKR